MDYEPKITGVMVYYYEVCKRKLWLFAHDVQMEHTSESVALGKLIDQSTYQREEKHYLVDGIINIDFIDGKKVIHEVKKSRSIEKAGVMQLKYYLYYLKSKGVEEVTGIMDYPMIKKRERITLDSNDSNVIEDMLKDIKVIIKDKSVPGVINQKICKKCAYYEICYI